MGRPPAARWALALLLGAMLLPSSPRLHPVSNLSAANGAWTVYHRDDGHTGYDPTLPAANGAAAGWTSATLDGSVYGEPLVSNGEVYAATLNNTVYALDQATGAVTWTQHLGTPESSGWSCGNVSPQGILGTPVIDAAAGRIYVAALLSTDVYHVFGLSLATGAVVMDTALNLPAAFDWRTQQERGALGLGNGYVYVPMGGRYGDCTPYYAWVVGVPTNGGTGLAVWQSPSVGEGAWAAGGVLVDDNTHDVIVATGNAVPCSGSTYSDAIVRLNSTLTNASFFEPNDWQANWCGPDLDLGSASPVIINNDLMFTAGKHGGGFLLDQNNLGGVNGQVFPPRTNYQQADVCVGNTGDATFGSFAYAAPYAYVECDGHGMVGLQVNTAAPSFSACDAACASPSWNNGGGETFGPPIVAGGVVWAVSTNGTGLWGFDAATGARVYQSAGFSAHHFETPSEAGGQLFAGAGNAVKEFNITLVPGNVRVVTAAPPGTTGNRPVTSAPAAGPGNRLPPAPPPVAQSVAMTAAAPAAASASNAAPAWQPSGRLRYW